MGAQGIGRPHHAVFSHRRRSADGQIVGADHLRGEQLRQQWRPPLSEMEGKGAFWRGRCRQSGDIFWKAARIAAATSSPLHGTGTGKSLRQSLFPKGSAQAVSAQARFSIWRTVWRTPAGFSPSTPAGKADIPIQKTRKHGPAAVLLKPDASVIPSHKRRFPEPATQGHRTRPAVRPRPSGEQLLGKLIPKPFVDQPDDAVHIKIRLAVRLHGQKLRFKFVVPTGSPHLIDGPPLAGCNRRFPYQSVNSRLRSSFAGIRAAITSRMRPCS